MPLQVDFTTQTNPDRLNFQFIETTGVYNANANIGGYGGINPAASSIDQATLTIQRRGDTVSYVKNMSVPPSTTTSFAQVVNNTDIGLQAGDKIPDGIYNLTYSVYDLVGNQFVLRSEMDYDVAFTEGIQCCLRKLMKNVEVPKQSPCGCSDKTLEKLAAAQALVDSVCYLVNCSQLDRAQEVISYIQGFCNCNCQDCTD